MQPQTHRNHTDSGMTFMTGHKQSREPAEAGPPGARRRALAWLLKTKKKASLRVGLQAGAKPSEIVHRP